MNNKLIGKQTTPEKLRNSIIDKAIQYKNTFGTIDEGMVRAELFTLLLAYETLRAKGLRITENAMKRYLSHFPNKTREDAVTEIFMMINNAEKLQQNHKEIKHFISTRVKPNPEAKYYKYNNWLLVIIGKSLITILRRIKGKWRATDEQI